MTSTPITAPPSPADLRDEYVKARTNLEAFSRANHAIAVNTTPLTEIFSTFAVPVKNYLALKYEEIGVWFAERAEEAQQVIDSLEDTVIDDEPTCSDTLVYDLSTGRESYQCALPAGHLHAHADSTGFSWTPSPVATR